MRRDTFLQLKEIHVYIGIRTLLMRMQRYNILSFVGFVLFAEVMHM